MWWQQCAPRHVQSIFPHYQVNPPHTSGIRGQVRGRQRAERGRGWAWEGNGTPPWQWDRKEGRLGPGRGWIQRRQHPLDPHPFLCLIHLHGPMRTCDRANEQTNHKEGSEGQNFPTGYSGSCTGTTALLCKELGLPVGITTWGSPKPLNFLLLGKLGGLSSPMSWTPSSPKIGMFL